MRNELLGLVIILVLVGVNTSDWRHEMEDLLKTLPSDCPRDYYGPGYLDDLLNRWCEPS